jgi:hypothetical protein
LEDLYKTQSRRIPHAVTGVRREFADGVRFHDLSRVLPDHPEADYTDHCCYLDQQGDDLVAESVARVILDDFETSPPE